MLALKYLKQAKTILLNFGIIEFLYRSIYFLCGNFFESYFYNNRIINCIRSLASIYPNFIDVGAHEGEVLLHVANFFNKCIAVEPFPTSFRSLILNINRLGLRNVIAFNVALGEESSIKTLYVPPSDDSSCSLAKIFSDMQEGPKIVVKTLDDIISEAALNGPFLIKIDVQGYELAVLRGGENTLSKKCAIICEFWPYGMVRSGYYVEDFIKFLRNKGFYPYDLALTKIGFEKLYSLGKKGINDPYIVIDVLFLKVGGNS